MVAHVVSVTKTERVFGYALRPKDKRTGERPAFAYVATIDGKHILGMAFRTSKEAIAYAKQVAELGPAYEP